MMIRITAALLAGALMTTTASAQSWSVEGPDGAVGVDVRLAETGGLQYRVRHMGEDEVVAIDWSDIGIVTELIQNLEMEKITSDFTSTVTVGEPGYEDGRETYTMTTGKRLENDTPWRQMSLPVTDDETGREMMLDVRVFPTGMGFRYRLTETSKYFHALLSDVTSFNIGEGGTHMGAPYDFYTMYNPSYERFYEENPTGTTMPENRGTGWGFPSLFSIRDRHILIHEADVGRDDQGWHLESEAPGGVYTVAAPMEVEAMGHGKSMPEWTLPWSMPWRFAVISENYDDIVESNMVFDLAAPSTVEDTSWIKPGVSSWNWLSDHDSAESVDLLKNYIDIAGDLDLPYTLIDADWNKAEGNAMEDLIAYAADQDVDLLFWYNSGGRHNVVPLEPRNRLDGTMSRRAEFAMLEEKGAKGIKVDFWQSDKQDMMALYHDLMSDAAEFHLLTNFHGTTIPRGWERTYPNHMTVEAVKGAEFYSFGGDYGEDAPRQNAMHPFLRNVIGPMDYTPILFLEYPTPRFTTNAHELALSVIFESGILHLADKAEGYDMLPTSWRNYLSNVPTVWDDTKLLAGTPGEFVVLARRSGDTWYIAGIDGTGEAREVSFDAEALEGLASSGRLFHDGEDFGFAEMALDGTVDLSLKPYGGFIIVAE